jgi:protein TonB
VTGVQTCALPISGPRVFHAAVRSAMLQYKCVSGADDVIAVQEFEFKIE